MTQQNLFESTKTTNRRGKVITKCPQPLADWWFNRIYKEINNDNDGKTIRDERVKRHV